MLAELENISYYVQTPGHNKRFPGHNSGGIKNTSILERILGHKKRLFRLGQLASESAENQEQSSSESAENQ